jgi:hypothetical protein
MNSKRVGGLLAVIVVIVEIPPPSWLTMLSLANSVCLLSAIHTSASYQSVRAPWIMARTVIEPGFEYEPQSPAWQSMVVIVGSA